MFKIVMLSLIGIMALAWIGYGIWAYRERQAEKTRPKPKTEHLKKVDKSFSEYTKKLSSFERKKYDRDKL